MKRAFLITLLLGSVVCAASSSWAGLRRTKDYTYIFAHYMTWFQTPEHDGQWRFWNWDQKGHRRDPERIFEDGRRDIASVYYPLIGPYSSTDEALLEYHILLAKAAGIDGFVVNWYGFKDEVGRPRVEDQGFQKLLQAAERLDFQVCINFDDKCMFPPYQNHSTREQSVAMGRETLRRVAYKYASSPAYFKLDKKPVLTNFGWSPPYYSGQDAVSFFVSEWKTMLEGKFYFIANHQWHWNKSILETGFLGVAQSIFPWVTGDPALREKFYVESQEALAKKKMTLVCGQACPGFDDWGTWGWGKGRAVIDRKDGALYRETWEESLRARSRWIQLITWNDFAEGTVIEPTREFGYHYLKTTAEYAAQLGHGHVDPTAFSLARAIYDSRQLLKRLKKAGSPSRLQAQVDLAVEKFAQGRYAKSRKLVEKFRPSLEAAEAKLRRPLQTVTLWMSATRDELSPGESLRLTIEMENTTSETQTGTLSVDSGGDLPEAWFKPARREVTLQPNERVQQQVLLMVPRKTAALGSIIEAQFLTASELYRSRARRLKITALRSHVQLEGPRLLLPGQETGLCVKLRAQQRESDQGSVVLELPRDWVADHPETTFTLPEKGSRDLRVKVKARKPGWRTLRVVLTSRLLGRQVLEQRFYVTQPGEVMLFHQDINNDGAEEFILGNDHTEVHVAPHLGGRLLAMYRRLGGHNQLFLDYPRMSDGNPLKDWEEYGGINDTFPTVWPGAIWNNTWEAIPAEEENWSQTLTLRCGLPGGLRLERRLTLARMDPALHATLIISNDNPQALEVVWNNHPDVAPGPLDAATGDHRMIVPTAEGLVKEAFAPTSTKKHFTPNAGWCVALDTVSGEYLAQRFTLEDGLQIGAWKGEAFFTMEVMPKPFVLKTQEQKTIKIDYIVGQGDWEKCTQAP